ncbi:pentapeptide repeat-containing protein [Halomicronema hongdechloris]|nr:pentapeptide repeat-containing protein [Halomicronema hongdechloris]
MSTTTEKDAKGNITKTVETITPKPAKTIWDWLSLLGVPVALAGLGYCFQQQLQQRARDETREEALQIYLDRLSTLLIDKNILASATELNKNELKPEQLELSRTAIDIIRARTLSILQRFEGDENRKGSVIRFLSEAKVISETNLNLRGANLSGIDLSYANLNGADLSGTNLSDANLSDANLHGAKLCSTDLRSANLQTIDLSYADLNGANLNGADLSTAILEGAILKTADLSNANLEGTKLVRADLSGANLNGANLNGTNFGSANFNGADLSGTKLKDFALLKEAKFCRTKLPDGIHIKPNRDCLELGINPETGFRII